jgi:putative membrane protein
MLDLALAIAHHLLVFSLFGTLAAELMMIRLSMTPMQVRRVAAVDRWYGILAAAILIVGFSRATFAAKGWDYYAHWAKMAAFLAVGLLSIWPTIRVLAWKRRQLANGDAVPSSDEISALQPFLWAELAVFVFIPVFAAAMTRGYGS